MRLIDFVSRCGLPLSPPAGGFGGTLMFLDTS